MPILTNPRHERFCQELAQGKSATQAYINAGYDVGSDKSANEASSRLSRNVKVQARLRELQGKLAADVEVTVQSLLREAAEIQHAAKDAGQMSAAVAALTVKAKLAGKLIDRKETGAPGEFGELDGMDADQLRAFVARPLPPDEQDETRH